MEWPAHARLRNPFVAVPLLMALTVARGHSLAGVKPGLAE
jgi:hypothetical protein